MTGFFPLEGESAIVSVASKMSIVYKQLPLYGFDDRLFVRDGNSFVLLYHHGVTSKSNMTWRVLSLEPSGYDKFGKALI